MPKKTINPSRASNNGTPRTPQGKDFHIELLNTAQKMAWQAFQQHDVLFLIGPAGVGKAQPLTSKIMIPNGYKTMGDMKIGEEISTPDGNTSRVIGVFPQGLKEIFKITFYDGTSTKCCGEHLWKVGNIVDGWKDRVVDTNFIKENMYTSKGRRKLYIQTTQPVQHTRKDYVISPYVMGILLGDGCFVNRKPDFITADSYVATKILSEVTEDYKVSRYGDIEYAIVKKKRSNKKNKYSLELIKYGLMGLNSKLKFIPPDYLYGAVDQRVALLQGLMDSDGTVCKINGNVSYSTSSPRLADDFCQLIQSLGGVARMRIKETTHSPNYNISVCLPNEIAIFSLPRKARLARARTKYFPKRYISNVEFVGEEETQCILVDSEDHLYLTDNYIVTHNTHLATAFALKSFLAKECCKIVITRPIVEAGEHLGFLPGEFENKVSPYMMPIYDCIDKLLGHEGPYREKVIQNTEVAPLAYLRGRSFANAVCLFDEAQNASMKQLKLFLTRFEADTKLIITGDPSQSDLPGTVALSEVVRKLSDIAGVGIVEFKANSIVRHPLVAQIIDKLGE